MNHRASRATSRAVHSKTGVLNASAIGTMTLTNRFIARTTTATTERHGPKRIGRET